MSNPRTSGGLEFDGLDGPSGSYVMKRSSNDWVSRMLVSSFAREMNGLLYESKPGPFSDQRNACAIFDMAW